MSNDNPPKYYAYKCSHPVATIHWASCPHCRFGRGQQQAFASKTDVKRGWTALVDRDEADVILLVQGGRYRFCGFCCRDLRDSTRRRA